MAFVLTLAFMSPLIALALVALCHPFGETSGPGRQADKRP